jgi:hypothetical protein
MDDREQSRERSPDARNRVRSSRRPAQRPSAGRRQRRSPAPTPNGSDADDRSVARLSDNSERLYESDNGVLGRPHRSAASGRSGASETEMTRLRIDSLSLMYKKSPDPGNFPTASRQTNRVSSDTRDDECDRPRHARFPRWLSGKPLSVPVHRLVVGRHHQSLFRIARFLGRQPSIGQDRCGLSHR